MGIKKWALPEMDSQAVKKLAELSGYPPIVCAVLFARGYNNPESIEQSFPKEMSIGDPFLMIDMDKAVERIVSAIEEGEKIAVFGDYDCDGITATALLTSYLQSMGADVIYYIPDREKEGYGLTQAAIDLLKTQLVTLIITVDNGISAHNEVIYAKTLGIDMVITDHHTPRESLPEAVAVVNPHRADCQSGYTNLAGVGVAFKLVCALEGGEGQEMLEYYSDLVMLGTVADVMELTGENREMVIHGLGRLAETERPGLIRLMEICGLSGKAFDGQSVAYSIIPRINAAGRMGCADDAVELLLTDDEGYAGELATEIDQRNQKRRETEGQMVKEIDKMILSNPQMLDNNVFIAAGVGWHNGVIGIVASRIMEKYSKPAILFSIEGNEARGSARSVEGFSMIEAINSAADILKRYGGHAMAAGLTLEKDKLEEFGERINRWVTENYPIMPVPVIKIDTRLTQGHLKVDIISQLNALSPFGSGNPLPLFLMEEEEISGIYPLSENRHLRIRFGNGEKSYYAVYFGMQQELFPFKIGDKVDFVANVTADEYNGKKQISVKIKDIRRFGVPYDNMIEEYYQYNKHLKGFYGEIEKSKLIPTREDFSAIYRLIRSFDGFRFSPYELYGMLKIKEAGFAKILVALDVMEEMGLILRNNQTGIEIIKTDKKVELEESLILKSLKS